MEFDMELPHSGPSNGFGTQFFNPTVGEDDQLCSLRRDTAGGTTWKYEMRREAQEVIPNLYIGPAAVAKELDKLQKLNITHILIIRPNNEASFVKPRFPERFQYGVLEAADSFDQVIIPLVNKGVQFIAETLDSGGVLYVHCGNGLSLSPTVVIGYLMSKHFMTYEQALKYLQGRRFCIAPSAHFAQQLKEFEAIYRAQIAMARNPFIGSNKSSTVLNPSGPGANSGELEMATVMRKRGMDDMSDDDEASDNKQPERTERPNNLWVHNGNLMMDSIEEAPCG